MGMIIGGMLAIPATSILVLTPTDSPGARDFAGRVIRWNIFWATRLLLNVLRSIPDLVWVLICIVVIGIGPLAGTLAIGLHTGGVLGKLYAETLEEGSAIGRQMSEKHIKSSRENVRVIAKSDSCGISRDRTEVAIESKEMAGRPGLEPG
jgi:hypothetical protein